MKIWQCYSGLAAQTWFYTDDQRIALQNQGLYFSSPVCRCFTDGQCAGQCLDLTNGGTGNSNVMQTWVCTSGNKNQIWTLS